PRDLVGRHAPREIAHAREVLSLRHERLTPCERLFGPLPAFDVGVDAVPLDDGAGAVTQRIRPQQKPSIRTVVPTQSCFGLSGRLARHDALPGRGKRDYI